MDIETISVVAGFIVMVFQAGFQWGLNFAYRKAMQKEINEMKEKMIKYDDDAIEFYKNLNRKET